MTFEYTETMIQQIESVGLTVEHFDDIFSDMILWLQKSVEEIFAIIKDMCGTAAEALSGFAEAIKKVEPRHRYKIVKKLGVENYEVFFKCRTIHRTRSCC